MAMFNSYDKLPEGSNNIDVYRVFWAQALPESMAASANDVSPAQKTWSEGMKIRMATWWLIPLSKWAITPVINGISRVNPLIIGVITHLLSGMSHQAAKKQVGIRYPRHPKTFLFWCWLVSNVNPSGSEDFYHPDETTDIHHQAARKALANRWD